MFGIKYNCKFYIELYKEKNIIKNDKIKYYSNLLNYIILQYLYCYKQ